MARTAKNKLPLKREAYIGAWRELAPDESFAGMTLAEFEASTEPGIAARERLGVLRTLRAAAVQERELADERMRQTLALVINAVRGAPNHGEDSPLYRAFGYVPKSERGSGLTRKTSTAPPAGSNADAV
jgi:hypothetical protein